MGYQMTAWRSDAGKNYVQIDGDQYFIGTVIDGKITKKFYRAEVSINRVDRVEKLTSTPSNVFVYLNSVDAISPGSEIMWKGSLAGLSTAKNPEGFDFKQFGKRKNIFYQSYANYWELISRPKFSFKFDQLREMVKIRLGTHLADQTDLSYAILLGDKSDLNQIKQDQFKASGLMHLMAVSGLHAGMFFSIFWLLFRFITPHFKYKKASVRIVALIAMWLFIGISGAPPSACRAGIMITIFSVAWLFQKSKNTLNILSFTALVMLVINPFQLFQLSFQFSFLAMLGILVLYPILKEGLNYNGSRVLNRVIDAGLIAIAAQIALFPCILFYFGEFPTYFLLSSILSLPLVPLIMLSGMGLFFSSFFSKSLAAFFGFGHEILLKALVNITEFISQLPFSQIQYLNFDGLQVIAMAFTILLLTRLVIHKTQSHYLQLFSFGFLIIFLIGWTHPRHPAQPVLTIYHNYDHLLLEAFDQGTSYNLSSNHIVPDHLLNSKQRWQAKYKITNHANLNNEDCFQTICRKNDFVKFHQELYWILNESNISNLPFGNIDVLVVNTHAEIDFDQIVQQSCIGKLVIPSHINYKQRLKLKSAGELNQFIVHDINKQGAFIHYVNSNS
jgi:competence protein ComEC